MNKAINKKRSLTFAAAVLSALCAATVGAGVTSALSVSAEEQRQTALTGFTCEGASVNAEEPGLRFVFSLSGDALEKKDLTAGVVYMPYDLYRGEEAAFLKNQANALTEQFNWKDNAETTEDETDLIGYTYLPASYIPASMYNRVLLVRGYIEDGADVYYTEPVKTSMAYSAWQATKLPEFSEYIETLKTYMGPYALTWGEGEADKKENLYYGDAIELPRTLSFSEHELNVEKWYWDEDKTKEISASDYITCSSNVYYTLEKISVSGTVSCTDPSVDLSSVKIDVDGKETNVAVAANGAYSLELDAGVHDFKFYCNGYVAYHTGVEIYSAKTLSARLESDLYDIGDFGDSKSDELAFRSDGVYTVSGSGYCYLMPNTATAENYEFTAKISTPDATKDSDTQSFGFAISNGVNVLKVVLTNWHIYVSVGKSGGGSDEIHVTTGYPFLNVNKDDGGRNCMLVRSDDALELWFGTIHLITITADGVTELCRTDAGIKAAMAVHAEDFHGKGILAGFFGEGVTHAVGLGSRSGSALEATYACKLVKGAKLEESLFAFGNHGAVKTYRRAPSSGDNVFTLNDNGYGYIMPNTATTGDYEFTVSAATKEDGHDAWGATSFGIVISNGTYVMTIAFGGEGPFCVQIGTEVGKVDDATNAWYTSRENATATYPDYHSDALWMVHNHTWKIVRTKDSIDVFDGNKTFLTVTADEIITNYPATDDGVTTKMKELLATFFGENVEHAVGLGGLKTEKALINCVFTCSYKDGDELKQQTYATGNHGSIRSMYLTPSSGDNVYTLNDNGYGYIMPNTATTGDYEFTVSAATKEDGHDAWGATSFGIVISNGTYVMTIAFGGEGPFCVQIGTEVGKVDDATNAWYTSRENATATYPDYHSDALWMVHNHTWKIVRTKDSIDVFDGNKTFLTVTADEIITNYPATDDGVTTKMKELLATFFGENVEHAVGLGGLKTQKALINCVFTCTYEKK